MEGETAVTIQELKHNYEELGSINEKQENRVRYIETQTTVITISYVLIQAVVFNSVSDGAQDHCKLWRVPFGMSFLIAVMFGVTFAAKTHEWYRTIYEFDVNRAGRESIYSSMVSLEKGCKTTSYGCGSESPKLDPVKLCKRSFYIYGTTLLLMGYTVLVLMACTRSSLCRFG